MYHAIKELIMFFQLAPVQAGIKVIYLPATLPNKGIHGKG